MTVVSRRQIGALGLGAALVAHASGRAFAQAPEIVIGAANPMSGVFAFAGVEGFEGARDYFEWLNRAGGVQGRRIRYVNEDSGYRVDQAVAIFTRLTSQHQIPVFFGDSTGFQKAINPELNRRGTTVMAGASFSVEIDDPQAFPNQWIPGPNYGDQMRVLLRYVASQRRGASVVLVHSDTEFGRDPIAAAEAEITRLGLQLVEKIATQPGSVDVSGDVLKIRRRNPDYVIFHGYVLQPIPEFMAQARQAGMTSRFMGTFYSTDTVLMNRAGAAADGYMGVSCYNFAADAAGAQIAAIREMNQGRQVPRTHAYFQGWMNAHLGTEVIRRTLAANQELNAASMMRAARSLQNFDTGGLMGVPISMTRNSFPVGRVYQYSARDRRLNPASDWISIGAAS
ncbi:MAG: ABC transporter substrate-binding protein [Alphaproteobacteria bacterium]|nr:ABC transporter substrate-binding protein [Alphaproteobacteria bacterium]